MVVVIGPIQVRRHHRDEIRSVLLVQELAVLQAGNLGQGIGLVSLLQRSGQEAGFGHRLRRESRIDTRGSQELQLLATVLPRRMDYIHLQNHVLVHEIRQRALVRDDAANFSRCKEHILRLLCLKERLHIGLARQIQFLMCPQHQILIPLPPQLPHNGRSHHPTMACDVYSAIFIHCPVISSKQRLPLSFRPSEARGEI